MEARLRDAPRLSDLTEARDERARLRDAPCVADTADVRDERARLRDAPCVADTTDVRDERARLRDAPCVADTTDVRDQRTRRAGAPSLFDPVLPRLAGFDEAGRGALAGPVVVGCVSFPPNFLASTERVTTLLAGVDDSKSLSAKAREAAFAAVVSCGRWSAGCAAASEIDRLGIVAAAELAARRAYRRLGLAADLAVFDRGLSLGKPVLLDPDVDKAGGVLPPCRASSDPSDIGRSSATTVQPSSQAVQQRRSAEQPGVAFTKGDTRSLHVAAASLVAKVTRDHLMALLDRSFAGYGLAQHKGYGTQGHRDALARRGPSRIHRLSFAFSADEADSQSC